MTTKERAQAELNKLAYDLKHGILNSSPAVVDQAQESIATIQSFLDGLDALLLESFRAGIKQEAEQHDFDYHGGKVDPSAEGVQA